MPRPPTVSRVLRLLATLYRPRARQGYQGHSPWLVGIAGEDDLDAPDLNTPEPAEAGQKTRPNGGTRGGRTYSGQKKIPPNRAANDDFDSANPRLTAQLSAVLRDQLMSELKGVKSAEDAALWARRILPAKNSLNVADARQIEDAFQARLAVVERDGPDGHAAAVISGSNAEQAQGSSTSPARQGSISPICPIPSRAAFGTGTT